MKRLLLVVAALTLGSACTGTYAADSPTTTTLENGWTTSDVEMVKAALRSDANFASHPYLTQECIIGGILTEFSPAQVRGELNSSAKRKVKEIMEIC